MLDDEKLKLTIEHIFKCSNKSAIDLFKHLIDKSACFRQGIAKDERTEIYKRGYGDFGLYLRSLLLEYAPEAYIEIIKKGVEENGRRNEYDE